MNHQMWVKLGGGFLEGRDDVAQGRFEDQNLGGGEKVDTGPYGA